ncbi:MAG: omega amino acid--pyruvate aminotransferase [Rhizobiales bacterium NRL2]|jgi:beta-alanine--pyruvate transaminase|nr:MAG: omega amino acid--pyruvate aminotransferase [Rhizobiales bacterium NRL2]
MTYQPSVPNDLDAFWLPFTPNRQFKKEPRLVVSAKDMHYTSADGRRILDGSAGLWCVNAGHARERIVDAIKRSAETLDFAPSFMYANPMAFELATKIAELTPDPLNRIFFTNSGSEAVDTALKIALAYHRARGEGQRTRLIGRERGYHGVGFGGVSVGGIVKNRNVFGSLLTGVDHLPHTHLPAKNAFTKGEPEHGAELADELERIVQLHDPSTVAAVIVEPMAGSTGVLVPPKGYLKRLREICDRHGILLIFDEVITGFGRLGTAFAAQCFGVTPDLMTMAKGLTNAAVPMGAVAARDDIYETFMTGPEHVIELFHGYTYSAHPMACAAGIAALDLYKEEKLFDRVAGLEDYWQEAVHGLADAPNVIDIRNIGLVGAIELKAKEGAPGKRGFDAMVRAFEKGAMIRVTADIIALSPPFIISKDQIDELMATVREVLEDVE